MVAAARYGYAIGGYMFKDNAVVGVKIYGKEGLLNTCFILP